MKRFIKYIFIVFCFLTSCQKTELAEIPSLSPGEGVYGEATISFSVSIPQTELETKAMGGALSDDLKNFYLIVFDENGYFVESRAAEYESTSINNGIEASNTFKVTLNLTDKKRIIHFIANCPVGQIRYGHENEMISSLYVTNRETAYWHRTVVDNILTDGNGNLVGATQSKFTSIPMLRNYAMITVVDNDDEDNFTLTRFGVYNTIDKGTVAPYNKSTLQFQPFTLNGSRYSYDALVGMGFEGHALIDATLNGNLTTSDLINVGSSYYMYERRVDNTISGSNEVPPHIILEGKFGDGALTYYKVDLVEEVDEIIKFYHILRNFNYVFKLKSVNGAGYPTIAEAMSKPASNNLSGSVLTQDLTNISDGNGRLYVSYTSVTLTSNDDVTLRFKYIPDIDNGKINNTLVTFNGLLDGTGSVLKNIKNIVYDAGDGWGEVTFRVQDPGNADKTQQIILQTGGNKNLNKTISFRLRKPYSMDVLCYDSGNTSINYSDNQVDAKIGQSVGVEIRLPDNLSSDMFPLDLYIEADKLSISPDAENNSVNLPVESGTSIIPGKDKVAFYYVYSIEDLTTFKNLESIGVDLNKQRVIRTNWLTSTPNNASYVVVANKYFDPGKSYFINPGSDVPDDPLAPRFYDVKFDEVKYGAGQTVEFQFKMTTITPVTVTLSGLTYNGSSAPFTYTPQKVGNQTLELVTTQDTGDVSVKLEATEYETVTSTATHAPQPHFIIDGFDKKRLGIEADEEVTFLFKLSDFEPGMTVNVTLEGLVPAEDNLLLATRAVDYLYEPTSTNCSIKLKTTAGAKTCSVQLSADDYYYNPSDVKTIEQKKVTTVTSKLTFDNESKRTTIVNNQEYRWNENDIVFIIEKNTSAENVRTNVKPIRIYSGQQITVSIPEGGVITKIEFDCNSNAYATTLQNSIGNSATKSADKVTISLDGTSPKYVFRNFTDQVRLDAITVTYEI